MPNKSKILIVDDEIRMLDSLKELLSGQDCEIHTSNSGAEAIDCLTRGGFDLVLLDIVMPGIDGFKVMDHIESQNPNTSVVIMTGHSTVDSAIAALRKGAYDYLKKPFEYEELLKTIENALYHNKLEKENSQVKKALIESEERFRNLIEGSLQGILIHRNHKPLFVNQTWADIHGYTPEEILNMESVVPLMSSRDQARMVEYKDARLQGEDTPTDYEYQGVRKDGSFIWLENRVRVVKWDGQPAIQTTIFNITKRKKTEEEFRESEERYRSLIEFSPDGICVSRKGKIIFVNQAMIHIWGAEGEDELIGKTVFDLIHPDYRDKSKERYQMMTEKGIDASLTDFIFLKLDNSEIHVQAVSSHVIIKGVSAVLTAVRDISEKKKAEAEGIRLETQLHHAQRMESLGTLAGGIAHDFNNLLMGIQGRASLMLLDTDSHHPHFEHLKGLEEYIKSASDLTKQLLAFARGGKYEVIPTDLNEIIRNGSEMFGRTKKEITIIRKTHENIWTVEVDRSQIEQVMLNLYVNAWQSMPGGGELYLETENVMLDDDFVRPYEVDPGKYVKVSVTDTGVGMDKATQERIFDPFFTTKKMGRGTGLGLASAYGIVKNHGGIFKVSSEKGEGAVFSIFLPASEKKVIKDKELSSEIMKGDETILLVDDEDIIIDVGTELLMQMGYKVLVAKSGKASIKLYEANKDKIDMVILDMIMPEMDGGETYDKMRKINPDIKVLLSSGYSIDGQATEILERGCSGFIQKPFNIRRLSQKIREIMSNE